MSSDRTEHQAKSVGDGDWVVSYLPGRTLDTPQAVAAIQAAETTTDLQSQARLFGLTAIEAAGLIAIAHIELGPRPNLWFRRLAKR